MLRAVAATISAALAARGQGLGTTVEIAPGVHMPTVLLGTGYMPSPSPGGTSDVNATATKATASWLAGGGRGIDTAYFYKNQGAIAAAVAASGVPRGEVFITSKIPGPLGYDESTAAMEADVAQLGGPLDMVIVHWCGDGSQVAPFPKPDCSASGVQQTWRAMEDFFNAGKARAIGISNYCLKDVQELLQTARVKPHVLQCERHPAFNQSVIVDFAKQNGIHFQGYAPLGDCDRATVGKDIMKDAGIAAIAKKMGASVAQVLLKWQLQDGISVPVRVQSGNPQHVKECVAAPGIGAIAAEDMQYMQDLVYNVGIYPGKGKAWPVGMCPENGF